MCGPGFVSGRRSVAKGRAEGAGRNSIFPVTVLRIAVYPVCWFASDKVLSNFPQRFIMKNFKHVERTVV